MINLKKLIENSVHIGHLTWRRHPKMTPYIWGQKNRVSLIDVSKTAFKLEQAAQFLEEIAAQGKQIMLVGTKRAAQECINTTAARLKCPYVTHRWVGGTLTNFSQVKKSITKLLHFEDVLAKADQHQYTKKEFGVISKNVDRLLKNVGGIRNFNGPLGALVVIDVTKDPVAIKEAQATGIPVVALVDTNGNPSGIEYVIPGNDDVPRAVEVIVNYLAEAIERGKARAKAEQPVQEAAVAEEMIVTDLLAGEISPEEEEEKPAVKRSRGPVRPAGVRGGAKKGGAVKARGPKANIE